MLWMKDEANIDIGYISITLFIWSSILFTFSGKFVVSFIISAAHRLYHICSISWYFWYTDRKYRKHEKRD